MIDLSSYKSIESAVFIKWEVPGQPTRFMSDYNTDITIDGDVYTNTGVVLGNTATQSEIKASPSQLTVGLSGVPAGSIAFIRDNTVRGSDITIYRGMFDPITHALLDLTPSANPVSIFKGIVVSALATDAVDPENGTATTIINLVCNSMVEVLAKTVSGRRTNKLDFPGELSMDKVAVLSRITLQFGGL